MELLLKRYTFSMVKGILKSCIGKWLNLFPVRVRLLVARHLKRFATDIDEMLTHPQQMVIESLIGQAIANSNQGKYDEAEQNLLLAAEMDPTNRNIPPHISRVRFLKSRACDTQAQIQTRDMHAAIQVMTQEIESKSIYIPGDFWDTVGKFHVQLLDKYGIENFKRTVSHMYQGWLMCNLDDPQVYQLFRIWPTHFSIKPWFTIIEVPDHVGLNPSMNFEDPTYPLADAQNRENYRISVGLLWEYVKNNDSFNIIDTLSESEIGNPIRIWREGKLISSDLAHSIRERNMLLDSLGLKGPEGLTVGELGAGYGRLAEVFGRTTNFRYVIFDITPALYVSQWYIKKIFPDEKIFEFRHFDDFNEIQEELQKSRFAFFTSNQIEKFPNDYFNLFINLNSLAEMRPDQIQNFLRQIDRITSSVFLSRQQIKSCNSIERVPLIKDDFRMPERWRTIVDTVDGVHPDFFNQIWKR